MIEILQIFVLGICTMFAVPVIVYLSVKLGTYAYLKTKRRFDLQNYCNKEREK